VTSPLPRAAPALAGLAWLAAFSLLYTLGDEIGVWPKLLPGAFEDVDLAAGMMAGALLLVLLVFPSRRKPAADSGSGPLG
jgi:hypothetical protein